MAAKSKVFALRMSPRLYNEIQKLASKDKSMNKIILDALDIYLGNMAIQQEAKESVQELAAAMSEAMYSQNGKFELALFALERLCAKAGDAQGSEFIKKNRGQ